MNEEELNEAKKKLEQLISGISTGLIIKVGPDGPTVEMLEIISKYIKEQENLIENMKNFLLRKGIMADFLDEYKEDI